MHIIAESGHAFLSIHVSPSSHGGVGINDPFFMRVCVCVFIELHIITAQPGPVILLYGVFLPCDHGLDF